MTFQILDRVQEITSTSGTGALALGGALTGFQAFGSVCSDQDTFNYGLQTIDSNSHLTGGWEVGVGTYNASSNTISRTTILASSNAGSVVNLPVGSSQVWIDMPASSFSNALQLSNLFAAGVTNLGSITSPVTLAFSMGAV